MSDRPSLHVQLAALTRGWRHHATSIDAAANTWADGMADRQHEQAHTWRKAADDLDTVARKHPEMPHALAEARAEIARLRETNARLDALQRELRQHNDLLSREACDRSGQLKPLPGAKPPKPKPDPRAGERGEPGPVDP